MFERTQIKCRHLIGSYGIAARARRRPFHTPAARRQYAPHIRTELNHIFLDLEVDPEQKGLSGVMRADLKVRAQEVDQLKFDQGNLEIQSVSVDGKSLKFEIGEEQLWVSLPQAKKRGEKIQVEVTYRVVNSGRGIYFTGPDSDLSLIHI